MKFNDFAKKKEELNISVDTKLYEDYLQTEISKFINKNNFNEIKNFLFPSNKISQILENISYPFKEHFLMKCCSGDLKKITSEHQKLKNWAEENHIDISEIDNLLYEFETFFVNPANSNTLNMIFSNILEETKIKCEKIIDYLTDLKYQKFTVKPLFSEKYIAEKFIVIYNDNEFIVDENCNPEYSLTENLNDFNFLENSNKIIFNKIQLKKPKSFNETAKNLQRQIALGKKILFSEYSKSFNEQECENYEFVIQQKPWKPDTIKWIKKI